MKESPCWMCRAWGKSYYVETRDGKMLVHRNKHNPSVFEFCLDEQPISHGFSTANRVQNQKEKYGH